MVATPSGYLLGVRRLKSSKPRLHFETAHVAHPTKIAIVADEKGVVLDRTRCDPEVVVRKANLRQIEPAPASPLTEAIFSEQPRLHVGVVLRGCGEIKS